MNFKKYQHIERYGTDAVRGIENGVCFIFPKIDGTNGSVWMEDGEICAGSRRHKLSAKNGNQGFFDYVNSKTEFQKFFQENPEYRLYGEFLVPHTLKTYEDSSWGEFYVFDVLDENENYLSYESYSPLLKKFAINSIPPLCKVFDPNIDFLYDRLKENTYLIKDGQGAGEGIVIKNYEYKNRMGKTRWAKIVRNDFKTAHKSFQGVRELKSQQSVEQKIVDKYLTIALVEKEYAKIKNESGWTSKMIPRLLGVVYYCLITEEVWNFLKEFKDPTVDFKVLKYWVNHKVKEVKPEIF